MVRPNEIRAGEVVEGASPSDASLVFIGEIRMPWMMDRLKCPRQGRHDGPICRIEVFAPWAEGLDGLDRTPLLDLKPDRGAFTPLAPP